MIVQDPENNSINDKFLQLSFHDGVPVYPYIAAITGHRTFYEGQGTDERLPAFSEETIKETFKTILTSIATRWKKECRGTAPLILLTGMADGADQITAQAALELKELNVKVIAVLPMEKSIYLNTITNRDRFDRILEQAVGVYEMPLTKDNIGKEAELCDFDSKNKNAEKCRQLQYEAVADFLALHSHVMFAVWDGIDHPDKKGGTSSAVRFKLEGDAGECEQERCDPLTFPSVGPVVHIMVTRDDEKNHSCPYPADLQGLKSPPVFIWTKEHTPPANRSNASASDRIINLSKIADQPVFVDVLPRFGKANRDSIHYYNRIKHRLNESQISLGISPEDFASRRLDNETSVLIRHFTVMDSLSSFFQKRTMQIIKMYVIVFFLFMFIGGCLASFWSVRQNGWGNIPGTLFFFLWDNQSNCPFDSMFLATLGFWLFFLMLLGTYFWAKHSHFHRRYHRYRALAEALRVQIFWRIAGMPHAVSGYYRSHQVKDLIWLRCALNGIDVLLTSPHCASEDLHDRINYVQECWITNKRSGQICYYEKAIAKRRAPWKSSARQQKGIFKTGMILFGALSFIATNKYIKIPLLGLFTILFVTQPVMDKFAEAIFLAGNETDCALCFIVAFGISCSFLSSLILVALLYVQLMRFEQEAVRYEHIILPYKRASILLNKGKARFEAIPVSSPCAADNAATNISKGNECKNIADNSIIDAEKKQRDIIQDRQGILCSLGTEALSENAEWLLSVGERELTLPR